MKVDSKYNDVELSGLESKSFKMELSAHAVEILTKKVYTDIPRAIVRELIFNGQDACVKARTEDPVEIWLPTVDNPTLVIEDFGCGMSPREIDEVYRVFFKSSKQGNNREVGMLGLGAKTPFAYTDQFTISTSKSGRKRTYLIFLNQAGIPDISEVGNEPCDRSGTRVELPIKVEDFYDFFKATVKTAIFMKKMPIIKRGYDEFLRAYGNSHGLYHQQAETSERELLFENNLWKNDVLWGGMSKDRHVMKTMEMFGDSRYGVVMGDVFYSVDSSMIEDVNEKAALILYPEVENAYRARKVLRIPIGSVDIQTSREALNYTDKTKAYLREKFRETFKTDVKKFLREPNSKFSDTMKSLKSGSQFLKVASSFKFEGDDEVEKKLDSVSKVASGLKEAKIWMVPRSDKPGNIMSYCSYVTDLKSNLSVSGLSTLCGELFFADHSFSFVEVDPKAAEKLSNRNTSKVPAYINNRLNLVPGKDDFILVDASGRKLVEKLLPGSSFFNFDLLREPKAPGEKNAAGTRPQVASHKDEAEFIDSRTCDPVTYDEIIKQLDAGEIDRVIYEVFTGSSNPRDTKTCWSEKVDVLKLRNGLTKKSEVDSVLTTDRGFRSKACDTFSTLNVRLKYCGLMSLVGVRVLAIRFSQLISLRLWEDERFIQYTEALPEMYERATRGLETYDFNSEIMRSHVFSNDVAEFVLDQPVVKSSTKFRSTQIYSYLQASKADTGTKLPQDVRRDLNIILKIFTDRFDRPDLAEKIKGRVVSISESIDDDPRTHERIEAITAQYPIFKFFKSLNTKDAEMWTEIVKYVEAN